MTDFFAGAIFIIISILFLGYLFPDYIGFIIGGMTVTALGALFDRMFRGKYKVGARITSRTNCCFNYSYFNNQRSGIRYPRPYET